MRAVVVLPLLGLIVLGSCNDGDSGDLVDAGSHPQFDAGGVFDPDNPGIHFFVSLGAVLVMSQPTELAVGGFLPSAREDFDESAEKAEITLDSCAISDGAAPTPSCENSAECAPEQECLPDYDDGEPIAGTEHCVTAREPLDLGPFTIEGFATGAIEMTYNAGQNGAYTAPGTDGTLNAGTLAFDADYTIHGAGNSAAGLGEIHGELYLAPALALTAPPMVDVGLGGMLGIEASPSQDLVLRWSGGNATGELQINLAGGSMGGEGGSIDCRVTDDGEFTIPAAMVAAAQLGDTAFFNALTVERSGKGSASAAGLTFRAIDVIQTLVISVVKVD